MPNNFYQNSSVSNPHQAALAESFRLWELKGRGWEIFNCETELEPTFSRFVPPQRTARPVDNARMPSLFGRLLSNGQNVNRLSNDDELSADNLPRIHPPSRLAVNLASFRLYLPNELKVSVEQTEQLLQTLASSAVFIGFEIIGNSQEIVFQITCPETEKIAVFAQLQSYLPTLDFRNSADALRQNFQLNRTNKSVMVDFGLGKEWFIPLPFGKNFPTDTLLPLIASMEELKEGEAICLQVLFRRTRSAWQRAVQDAIFDRQGKPVFANLNNHLAGIKEKLANPLLAASLRLVAQSSSSEKSIQIVRRTSAFFRQFSAPSGNELIPLRSDALEPDKHLQSFLNRTTYRNGILLAVRECSSIFHLPSDAVKSPKLKRDENLTKPAPDFAMNGNLVLGENHHAGMVKKVSLSSEKRIKHTHLIGASGSGKSTLLLQMMSQDLELRKGFACFDPHGDLIDGVLERIPASRLKDVILFDPSDENFPIGFNILTAHSELEKTLLSSDLVAVFRRFSTSWGDQMNSVLANAILAFLESSRGGNLLDLKRFLIERSFREDFLKTVRDEEIRYYWQREFPELKGKPYAPLLTRLDTFLRSKLIRHIVAQNENRLDFRRIMDDEKIFLVRLSLGAIGEENAYLLGSLLVAKLYLATLSRQNVAEDARSPFFLYLDEAHHFLTPSMNQILSGVRKYKLGLTLAHQQLDQFKTGDADILSSVLANCYTRICFRLDDRDAERLARGFSFFSAEHLKNLGVGEAIVRFEQSQYSFNLKTFPLAKVAGEIAAQRREAVIKATRERYARPKAEVETALQIKRGNSAADKKPLLLPETSKEDGGQQSVKPITRAIGTIEPEKETASLPAIIEVDFLPQKETVSDQNTSQHRYLQSLVKRIAENKGFLVTLEKEIFGGIGRIDAALEKEAQKIAVEISVSNEPDYETRNIQKCLAAGYAPVVMISADGRHLKRIKQKTKENLSAEDFGKTEFFAPEEFYTWLENLETTNSESEAKIKGFRVKVRLKPVEETSRGARQKAISEVVLGGLKKAKKTDERE